MGKYILALDQGTTSSRSIIFDRDAQVVALAQKEFPQIYPLPGWVEHNPLDIWESQYESAIAALKNSRIHPREISAIGITNQRETTLLWNRKTGIPVHNAIVWQCRRTAAMCDKLKQDGLSEFIRMKTGLIPDAYFSATKLKWLFDSNPDIRKAAVNGELCFGTVDSWLLYNLTGEHATDPSNASRTMLFNIHSCNWDRELLELFDIPEAVLPEVKISCGLFGTTKKQLFGTEIPVCSMLGDQQAALFGQGCFLPGTVKTTYGTGCFTLLNTGSEAVTSTNKLLTTIAWNIGDGPVYALEGSVFIGGAVVQWLRDELKFIVSSEESEELAATVPGSDGVIFVPAFVGLGAPYWDQETRGTIFGLTRGSNRAHLARAALESIAFQCCDLIAALEQDVNRKLEFMRVDGGASANKLLMQFQSDLLGIPLE
ncbi:MAG: glycerol kinase GlpK, partial [Victivallaceae bacterium]